LFSPALLAGCAGKPKELPPQPEAKATTCTPPPPPTRRPPDRFRSQADFLAW
jgi:peptidoglycan-associated lipoprotein